MSEVGGVRRFDVIRDASTNPMTLGGTNTWLVGELGEPGEPGEPGPGRPGSAGAHGDIVVIDPGFSSETHLRDIRRRGRVRGIVLTHRHGDHTEGADDLAAETGAPVHAADPALVRGGRLLADGDSLTVGGVRLTVLRTPGHTDDSICLELREAVPDARLLALVTGDTLLGGSSTVVDVDGGGGWHSYLDSLERLSRYRGTIGLPGHGPVIADVGAWAAEQALHRARRIDDLSAILPTVPATGSYADYVERLADVLYAELPGHLRRAALISVSSMLAHLRRDAGVAR